MLNEVTFKTAATVRFLLCEVSEVVKLLEVVKLGA